MYKHSHNERFRYSHFSTARIAFYPPPSLSLHAHFNLGEQAVDPQSKPRLISPSWPWPTPCRQAGLKPLYGPKPACRLQARTPMPARKLKQRAPRTAHRSQVREAQCGPATRSNVKAQLHVSSPHRAWPGIEKRCGPGCSYPCMLLPNQIQQYGHQAPSSLGEPYSVSSLSYLMRG